ncbi:MAG: DUF4390 domain-containing protein [Paludibacterium sp.]|uniref:DUF4390 domain-containing protein n=1 Tax=Paludibacterium sp. TaxID=1917523 RepID=UPI0025DD568E|nr:DUF4390 domain-containing protein [Paludibacterium sp.]MBV8047502.1 DUF4390 domain-containing protein [Paludibacterium sp.]MBV8648330.1 DUF4390 domain-containing protein [Paludibacterium sp.]
MTAFITRCLRNVSWLVCLLLCLTQLAWADNVSARRAEAELVDGQLAISTRFGVKLPAGLGEALTQGVPLTFRLEFELTRPRTTAYYLDISQWFSPHASMTFKLSYQPLTDRYRVAIGSFSSYYSNLNDAMRAVGAIQSWRVLNPGTLSGESPDQVAGRVRLVLDISELPKPFQLNALGSADWTLASNWVGLDMKGRN